MPDHQPRTTPPAPSASDLADDVRIGLTWLPEKHKEAPTAALDALLARCQEAEEDYRVLAVTRERGCACGDDEACAFLRRAEAAEAERDEARATKDMHKERYQQVIETDVLPMKRERDAAESTLRTLRDAWNAHMAACPAPVMDVPAPTHEQITAWLNAPGNTASAASQREESGE